MNEQKLIDLALSLGAYQAASDSREPPSILTKAFDPYANPTPAEILACAGCVLPTSVISSS